MDSLPDRYRAVVFGASGALGQAFVQALQQDPRCGGVWAFSRTSTPTLVLENEATIAACAAAAAAGGPFHLLVNATGALTVDGRPPEKRLADLDPLALQQAFAVNAIGPAMLMKHFVPLMARAERAIFATLSARVGSIEDNHKGGWWGYRAAKAALNMLLQTTAIEAARQRPLAVFAALQPGTVRSRLSAPFVPGDQALAPDAAATRLLTVLDTLPATDRAQFVDHRGQTIPW